jgi:hypothetical protein
MPLMLPNARQYQGARGTRAQGSVSSREVVVLKSTSSTEAEPAAPPAAAMPAYPHSEQGYDTSLTFLQFGRAAGRPHSARPTRSPECRSVPLSIEQNSAVCWLAAAGYF